MKAFVLVAAAVGLSGCKIAHMFEDQGPQIQGSGKVKSETRKVGNFTHVVSGGSANCRITVGPAASVEVKADDNILPLVETKVEKGALIVETKGSYSTKSGITVTITVPNLESYKCRGAGNASIDGLKGKAFEAEISGAGGIHASGQTDRLTLSIRGSGEMNFLGVKARDAAATISGSGDIQLFVMGTLDAAIRGSGNINYAGKPDKVNKSVSGSGEIDEK